MKRRICVLSLALVLLVLVFASVGSLFASADTTGAAVKVEQISDVSSDGLVTVRVSFADIHMQGGILIAEYVLHYDVQKLELVSWKNAYPQTWDIDGGVAEDWSSKVEPDNGDPYFKYTVLNVDFQGGVKDDGVLYSDLTFRVHDANATLSVEEIEVSGPLSGANLESFNPANVTFAIRASSASDPSQSSTPSQSSGTSEAKRVTMQVSFGDLKNSTNLASVQMKLQYDASAVKYVSCTKGDSDAWKLTALTNDNELTLVLTNVSDEEAKLPDVWVTFEMLHADDYFSENMVKEAELVALNRNGDQLVEEDLTYSFDYSGNALLENRENEGRTMKIIIAVTVTVAVLVAAVVLCVTMRGKKGKRNA